MTPCTGTRPAALRHPRLVGRVVAGLLLGLTLVVGGCSVDLGPSSAPSAPATPAVPETARTVPLQVLQQDEATVVIAPVSIGGRGPYPFILDTGASTSAVNADLAQQLGLQTTGQRRTVRGVTSAQTVQIVQVPSWQVGDVDLAAGSLGALDFPSSSSSSSPSASGSSIAGLLGSDQLSRFGSVTIDYAGERLTLTPR